MQPTNASGRPSNPSAGLRTPRPPRFKTCVKKSPGRSLPFDLTRRASVSGNLAQLPRDASALGRKDRTRFRKSRNSVGVSTFGRPTPFRPINFAATVPAPKLPSRPMKVIVAQCDQRFDSRGNSSPNLARSDRTVPSHGFLGRFRVRQKTYPRLLGSGQFGAARNSPRGSILETTQCFPPVQNFRTDKLLALVRSGATPVLGECRTCFSRSRHEISAIRLTVDPHLRQNRRALGLNPYQL